MKIIVWIAFAIHLCSAPIEARPSFGFGDCMDPILCSNRMSPNPTCSSPLDPHICPIGKSYYSFCSGVAMKALGRDGGSARIRACEYERCCAGGRIGAPSDCRRDECAHHDESLTACYFNAKSRCDDSGSSSIFQ